jgi:hypothetical protein
MEHLQNENISSANINNAQEFFSKSIGQLLKMFLIIILPILHTCDASYSLYSSFCTTFDLLAYHGMLRREKN